MNDDKHQPNNALLVEDDGDDRLKIRLLLEVMGFTVYETPSPIEARELFALRDYSLVVIHLGHAPLAMAQMIMWPSQLTRRSLPLEFSSS